MTSWLTSTLTAGVLLVLAGYFLLPAVPSSEPTLRPAQPLDTLFEAPGPVIASRIDHLDLDGLTIIPV